MLSGAWFEAVAVALFAILILVTGYRPPWWNWTGAAAEEKTNRRCKRLQEIPGPLAVPILGTRWIFSFFGRYRMSQIHEAYKDLNRRYGPICKEEALWNFPVVSIFSRKDVETVLRRGSRLPLRPPSEVISHYRISRPDRYTNLGLVNEQGPVWQKLRSALTPELMSANTVLGFLPALNDVVDDFINLIQSHRNAEGIVEGFEDLAYRMGLESTCTLILGRRMGFLEANSESRTARLAEAVKVHFCAQRDAFYGLPLWKLFPTKAYRQLIESEDTIYDTISELVESTVTEQQGYARDEKVEAVFWSILREKNLDMRDKKAAIIDFIAAGIHTLGNTLVFLLDLVGRNEEVQKRLYEEVSALAPRGCNLTADDLRDTKYLRACINEAFRVLPTAPCIARILEEPMELGGYQLDAGTVVLCHTWIAGLAESSFKNADEFKPERWLRPSAPHSPLLVAPFGTGRRICPGKRFVEQALQLILAKVVQKFEMSTIEDLKLQFEFILSPKGPANICFQDRLASA